MFITKYYKMMLKIVWTIIQNHCSVKKIKLSKMLQNLSTGQCNCINELQSTKTHNSPGTKITIINGDK